MDGYGKCLLPTVKVASLNHDHNLSLNLRRIIPVYYNLDLVILGLRQIKEHGVGQETPSH